MLVEILLIITLVIICIFAWKVQSIMEDLKLQRETILSVLEEMQVGMDILLEHYEYEERLEAPEPIDDFDIDEGSLYYDKNTGLYSYDNYKRNLLKIKAEEASKLNLEGME